MAIKTICKGFIFASILMVMVLAKRVPAEQSEELDNEKLSLDSERLRDAEERIVQEQATNAVYKFATSIVDGIMDNMQVRTESRNGLNLTGSYGYSDGFVRRLVEYVADQYGYRIVRDETVPVGDGPRVDPNGKANIRTSLDGENFEYNITKADIGRFQTASAEEAALA